MNDDLKISRASFVVAAFLGLVGLLRLAGDYLTDRSPAWTEPLLHTWMRYVVRTASDGSSLANLDVQFFKVLAVPCGVSVAYYLHLVVAGRLSVAERAWRTPRIRALYVVALLTLCTLIEVEKASHALGLGLAGLLPGETAWENHVVHLASAALGWQLAKWMRYVSSATIRSPFKGATSSPRRL